MHEVVFSFTTEAQHPLTFSARLIRDLGLLQATQKAVTIGFVAGWPQQANCFRWATPSIRRDTPESHAERWGRPMLTPVPASILGVILRFLKAVSIGFPQFRP